MTRTSSKTKQATAAGSPAGRAVKCPICLKLISRKNDLNRHLLTHNKDKSTYPYRCPYPNCEFRSLQESNLKTHYKIHTGVKDKKCSHAECLFATSDPGSLTRHRKRKHDYVPLPRRKFNNASGLFESPCSTTLPNSRSPTPEPNLSDSSFSPISPSPCCSESLAFSTSRTSASIHTPDYVASPILRPASFDYSTMPRSAPAASQRVDTRITLPSISSWYREDARRPLYESQYQPLPSSSTSVSCSGCPDCDRQYMAVVPAPMSFWS
ncbi:hypothetical protein E1B28_012500 [Marasmius oreades]|uniref:C2H2-type domain-containing protein n=1 Tax=Marasmius oreades TaxID=181124 RepID=A0A9P7UPZ9_9AGAR|nr:uncharacterized protein E1B28_012500 [Marasmius oreades]KAG7088516.1 hypothetical protein E1B28_012500 [Marasmius oreades]